jgi:glutamine amidotransferase
MQVAIVKYNAGNTQSLSFALQRLGIEPLITDDLEQLQKADKVIFPGVGEASSAMKSLKAKNLHHFLPTLSQPFLGICLGMQLMCAHSEENNTDCLGVFSEQVKLFTPPKNMSGQTVLKVPHMGWNTLKALKGSLFDGLGSESYVYFVHSYYVEASQHTTAVCEYGLPFSAALQKNNFYAVQFHPEKSASAGAKILENFLKI